MNQHVRTFEDKPATRVQVPLLIGLMGPSGGGKTFSALRLATGIQTVSGGEIYVIDTEARRSLHYSDRFKFRHLEFGAPFGPLDYLAAIHHCVGKGAGVVIVDSMSHEHEGQGGVLEMHERELDRMAGDDRGKRERMNMLAWAKPKAARRSLINGLLQLNTNFVFCFRAKEKVKPVKRDGKSEVENQGWMPIAGEEFVYEQTLNCLLLPGSKGVPTWESNQPGERAMMKLPEQFRDIMAKQQPLSEDIGKALAQWAKGAPVEKQINLPALIAIGNEAAMGGTDVLEKWWTGLEKAERQALKHELQAFKEAATQADREAEEREKQGALV